MCIATPAPGKLNEIFLPMIIISVTIGVLIIAMFAILMIVFIMARKKSGTVDYVCIFTQLFMYMPFNIEHLVQSNLFYALNSHTN